MVGDTGFEPVTPSMSRKCANPCANRPKSAHDSTTDSEPSCAGRKDYPQHHRHEHAASVPAGGFATMQSTVPFHTATSQPATNGLRPNKTFVLQQPLLHIGSIEIVAQSTASSHDSVAGDQQCDAVRSTRRPRGSHRAHIPGRFGKVGVGHNSTRFHLAHCAPCCLPERTTGLGHCECFDTPQIAVEIFAHHGFHRMTATQGAGICGQFLRAEPSHHIFKRTNPTRDNSGRIRGSTHNERPSAHGAFHGESAQGLGCGQCTHVLSTPLTINLIAQHWH
jgi:hypothetical protein